MYLYTTVVDFSRMRTVELLILVEQLGVSCKHLRVYIRLPLPFQNKLYSYNFIYKLYINSTSLCFLLPQKHHNQQIFNILPRLVKLLIKLTMIPNFSPPLSYGQFNDEPTNHGRLSELSSSTLPSLSRLFSDDHEHERNNRGLLSDHGVSFSPSRLPSSSSHLLNEGEASLLSSLLPSILSSSFSHHEREPADRGWLSDRGASFSSSRLPSSSSSSSRVLNECEASVLFSLLPSILPSSFSHHEREPADRGASFSSSRLPSSFSRFSDDVSSDDDEDRKSVV